MRRSLRRGHTAAAAIIGTDPDSPRSADPAFAGLVRYALFPVMAASGPAMRRQPRLRRWPG